MNLKTRIESKIKEKLAPTFSEVVNESHGHNVPKNSETHFKVTVVSESFEGQNPVQRHRTLYQLLEEERQSGVHALALHLYTPLEWEKKKKSADSPPCEGGSKS
jgi:BolA protein